MSTITNLIFKNEKHYITSKFGARSTINTSAGTTSSYHSGVDYGTNNKKIPQYAIEDGYCFASGKSNSDGANYVWVIYPRIKKAFIHYHLDTISIKAGAKVVKGTKLGTTGMTGKATGIHLHLGVRDLSSLSTAQINKMTWDNLRKCPYIDAEGIKYTEPKKEEPPKKETPKVDPFLPAIGYWKKGDKGVKISYMCDFFYKTFPGYGKTLKRNKENLKGDSFGVNLEAWVKLFQKNTGLPQTGRVDEATLKQMRKYGFKH